MILNLTASRYLYLLQQCYRGYISRVFGRRDSFTFVWCLSQMLKYYLGQEWVLPLFCLCKQSEKINPWKLGFKFCKILFWSDYEDSKFWMDNVFLVMLLEMFIEDFQACYLPFRKAHTNVLYQVQLQHVCTSIWFSGQLFKLFSSIYIDSHDNERDSKQACLCRKR